MTTHQLKTSAIVSNLLKWYPRNARDLPWRRTNDPYGVFVSEIMLQQTQVKTVLRYWERWMRELPDIRSLVKATPQKIHKLWEGLGYYTRVRNMQKASEVIVEKHDGIFPQDFEQVLDLPGVGRYTAGAICSIAFNQPKPILDGNVIRVLTRVFGIAANPREKKTNARLWEIAQDLVNGAAIAEVSANESRDRDANGDGACRNGNGEVRACSHLNQALMELGALTCTPNNPQCNRCPLANQCVAFRDGKVHRIPKLAPRPQTVRRYFAAFILERNGRFLVRQRPAKVVNAHLWEFPSSELTQKSGEVTEAAKAALEVVPDKLEPLCEIHHSITRYRIRLQAFRVWANPRPGKGQWITRRKLASLPFSSAHGKILRFVLRDKLEKATTPSG